MMETPSLEARLEHADRNQRLSRREFLAAGAAAALTAAADSSIANAASEPSKEDILRYLRRRVPVTYVDSELPRVGSDYRSTRALNGKRRSGGLHNGIDMAQPYGTPVVAAAPGWARNVRTPQGGLRVEVYHEQKLYLDTDGAGETYRVSVPLSILTTYAHLSRSEIPQDYVGKKHLWVKRGDVIGAVGRSGSWSGDVTHLHFGAHTKGPYSRWDVWKDINPHLLWADGPGKVTRYDPSRTYSERAVELTYPLNPIPANVSKV